MKSLTEFIISIFELFEAEGAALRRNTWRLLCAAALLIVVIPLAIGGVALIAVAIYLALAHALGHAGAALASGLFALVVAGVLICLARKLVH